MQSQWGLRGWSRVRLTHEKADFSGIWVVVLRCHPMANTAVVWWGILAILGFLSNISKPKAITPERYFLGAMPRLSSAWGRLAFCQRDKLTGETWKDSAKISDCICVWALVSTAHARVDNIFETTSLSYQQIKWSRAHSGPQGNSMALISLLLYPR